MMKFLLCVSDMDEWPFKCAIIKKKKMGSIFKVGNKVYYCRFLLISTLSTDNLDRYPNVGMLFISTIITG